MEKERLLILLREYLNQDISASNLEELSAFASEPQNKEAVVGAIVEAGMNMKPVAYDSLRFGPLLQKIITVDKSAPIVPLRRRVLRWAVAASILIAISITAYLLVPSKNGPGEGTDPVAINNNISAPEKNRAFVRLADGRMVFLDSVGNGQLATQQHIQLIKTADDKITYQSASPGLEEGAEIYNTLTNPRGSKVIDMTLSDGSHVWLNAGSSVTYPVAFVGNERKVGITGEAYFEVAHNASKPFYVTKGDVEVKVLGTHFNVNAYDDEKDIKVTLLEGSVKVSQLTTHHSQLLKPDQQAIVANDITINKNIDTDAVMAWKNGLFSFNQADVKTVMRQIARWYDVEIEYQGSIPQQQFSGKIGRDLTLSEVLNGLQKTKINFRIEGKKIVIVP